MRILLVEDDDSLADGITRALKRDGYAVDAVATASAALDHLRDAEPDLIVLDLGLPDMEGVTLLRRIRTGYSAPVLILTARDELEDKVRGLDAGADDYLTKPFALAELLARLRALERRTGHATSAVVTIGPVTLDLAMHSVKCEGREVAMSRREFALLRALMEQPGKVHTREQLERKLYSWGDEVASNTIDVHIHNLRRKLYPDFIKTLRGVGYTVGGTSGG